MYKTILHATDLSENHFDLCQKAVNLAHYLKAKLYFIHVIETPPSLQWAQSLGFAELATPVKDGALTVMSALGDALGIAPSHLHVEIGSTYLHILNKINELGCDLVILGSHTTGALPTFQGSTAHALSHHARCDILTLRASE